MKIVMRLFLLFEVCLMLWAVYIIRLPRYSIEDTYVVYFRDLYDEMTEYKQPNVMKNFSLMQELDLLYEKVIESIDSLKDKTVQFTFNDEVLEKSLSEYISVTDVKANNQELDGYPVELNYLTKKKSDVNIELLSSFKQDAYIQDAIDVYMQYNEAMKWPSAKMGSNGIEITDPGKEGKELNTSALIFDLEGILANYTQDEKELGVVEVVYNTIKVFPSVEDILAIKERISTFSTGYSSSASSRKTNIAVATNNINGTLVAPGEVISVDKLIKSRVAANGYEKAGSYLNGKTVQTYGGGVCQVSSTLYGAIIRAGLIPVERNAHSMAVSYVPLGLDAAISEGVKDLKIKNTYDSPIFITSSANGSTVTFNVYGKEGLLEGYTYQPVSSSGKNGLYANSWLNKVKNGEVVEKIHLFESSYRPHG